MRYDRPSAAQIREGTTSHGSYGMSRMTMRIARGISSYDTCCVQVGSAGRRISGSIGSELYRAAGTPHQYSLQFMADHRFIRMCDELPFLGSYLVHIQYIPTIVRHFYCVRLPWGWLIRRCRRKPYALLPEKGLLKSVRVITSIKRFFQCTEWLWKIVLLTLAASRGVTDLPMPYTDRTLNTRERFFCETEY